MRLPPPCLALLRMAKECKKDVRTADIVRIEHKSRWPCRAGSKGPLPVTYSTSKYNTVCCVRIDVDLRLNYIVHNQGHKHNIEQLLPCKVCLFIAGTLENDPKYDSNALKSWQLVSFVTSLVSSNTSLLLPLVLLAVTLSQWKMEVDEALGQLGIGRWQILHFTTISVAWWTTSCFHALAIIYIGKPKCSALRYGLIKRKLCRTNTACFYIVFFVIIIQAMQK